MAYRSLFQRATQRNGGHTTSRTDGAGGRGRSALPRRGAFDDFQPRTGSHCRFGWCATFGADAHRTFLWTAIQQRLSRRCDIDHVFLNRHGRHLPVSCGLGAGLHSGPLRNNRSFDCVGLRNGPVQVQFILVIEFATFHATADRQ